jgi:hypothetical protein
MDPISAIVGALAAGAAAVASNVANKAVSDAYDSLKSIIATRFRRKAAVETIEEAPESASARAALGGALKETGADSDSEVKKLALALAAALHELGDQHLGRANIKIGDVDAYRHAIVRDLAASGTIAIDRVIARTGDVIVEHVEAGSSSKKNR